MEGEKKIKDDFMVSPKIMGWPYRSFKQFKNFAQEYSGDNYWVAITILLERSKRLEMYEGAFMGSEEELDEKPVEEEKPIHLGGEK